MAHGVVLALAFMKISVINTHVNGHYQCLSDIVMPSGSERDRLNTQLPPG